MKNKLTWDQAILVEVMRWVWWIMSSFDTERNRPYMLMFGVDPAEIESYLDRADMAAEDYHLILKRRCAHLTATQQLITIEFLEEITAKENTINNTLYQPSHYVVGQNVFYNHIEGKITSVGVNLKKKTYEYCVDLYPNMPMGKNIFYVTEPNLMVENLDKTHMLKEN